MQSSLLAAAGLAATAAFTPALALKNTHMDVLYAFGSVAGDGLHPSGHLLQATTGEFYGVTRDGGTDGLGTVYRLSPPQQQGGAWTEAVLWSFQRRSTVRADGAVDGTHPSGPVTLGTDGAIYGTTETGGARQLGTVYRLLPPAGGNGAWTEQVLYTFRDDGIDLATPKGGVIFDKAGHLLLTASAAQCTTGGECAATGGVLKLIPKSMPGKISWNETIIWQFGVGADGAKPEGQLYATTTRREGLGDKTNQYILTTSAGGASGDGTLVLLTPPRGSQDVPWAEQVIHDFAAAVDGAGPGGFLLANGGVASFLGATSGGGTVNHGTLFQSYVPSGQSSFFTQKISDMPNGVSPVTPLGGRGTGVTASGGAAPNCGGTYQDGCGVVFQLSYADPPPWGESELFGLTRGKGANPQAGLTLGADLNAYGVTYRAGPNDGGTAFRFTPN